MPLKVLSRVVEGQHEGFKTATMVLYMTNIIEILYKALGFYKLAKICSMKPNNNSFKESAVYPLEKFMSDVGGTAGLMLGMSLATVIGLVDVLISKCNY